MKGRRFKFASIALIQTIVVQLGFSLLFIPGFAKKDPVTIATFCLVAFHTLLSIAICASHHYTEDEHYAFYERWGIVVYNMTAAAKLIAFSTEPVCESCHASGAVRIGAALLECGIANIIQAHVWRRRRLEEELYGPGGLLELEADALEAALPLKTMRDLAAQREGANMTNGGHDVELQDELRDVSLDDVTTIGDTELDKTD